ncbi:DUF5681 domain-containing protein [Defluviimonas sp. SAOS-178_SWC]|uniref:DUF5681 domain-containing protein n=1 Tax=Defluviimonas sp. SAOS-178_SWC TaxID=3121287 RepID=UPI003221BA45
MSTPSDMAGDGPEDDAGPGYRHPPRSTRFKKGQSGNPRGRPRGRHREAPYDAVLGQEVTIRDGGVARRVTAAEAFLLHLAKRGLEGDGAAARAAMAAIAQASAAQAVSAAWPREIILCCVAPGSVTSALEPLRMGRKRDPYRPTARMLLEPWIVAAALARLGDRHLSRAEQETVFRATRTPHKVRWPDWWEVRE